MYSSSHTSKPFGTIPDSVMSDLGKHGTGSSLSSPKVNTAPLDSDRIIGRRPFRPDANT